MDRGDPRLIQRFPLARGGELAHHAWKGKRQAPEPGHWRDDPSADYDRRFPRRSWRRSSLSNGLTIWRCIISAMTMLRQASVPGPAG